MFGLNSLVAVKDAKEVVTITTPQPKDHIEAANMHNVKLLARYTHKRDELEDLIARSREELEQVETVIASLEQAQRVLDADFKQKMDAAAKEAVDHVIA